MASRELQGWHPDPFGTHEMRYFSVGRPTKLVRDRGVDTYDDPPADLSSPGAASSAEAVAVGEQVVSVAMSAPPMPTTLAHGQPEAAAPTRVLPPLPADHVPAPPARSPAARPRPRRRWVEYAFVAAGAVVAVVVFVALEGGGSGKPGIAPAAFVTRAAQQTLAEHTTGFSLSARSSVDGQTVAIAGNGEIDLATGAMSLTVAANMSSGAITESELEVGGNSYLKMTENGKSLPLTGGRHWIEMPFAPTTVGSSDTASPDSTLELLSQRGARVTPLGTENIGGQTCIGYSVIPSTEAMVAGTRQEFAKLGLSSAETNAALQAVQNVQPPSIAAWFGTKTNLTCQVTFSMQFGAPTSSGSGGVQAQLTFTHYGAPVNIATPPASDTVDLEQYLHGTNPA